jgi:hypothetical protein
VHHILNMEYRAITEETAHMQRIGKDPRRWIRVVVLAAFMALPQIMAVHAQGGGVPSVTLPYTDSQGPGCVSITSMGDDQNAGGTAISVSLAQNGMSFSGQGEEWITSDTAPRTFAIAFWLNDGNGNSFFFDGTLKMGVDTFGGQGQWTSLQDPTITDQWRMFRMFGGPAGACTSQ